MGTVGESGINNFQPFSRNHDRNEGSLARPEWPMTHQCKCRVTPKLGPKLTLQGEALNDESYYPTGS